ncbi:hypothetical protein HDV00_008834 [Rhizophlyctis rosea]|nr:hypothetical protein HDV00_008834 [Rhizophlyctis rosea]
MGSEITAVDEHLDAPNASPTNTPRHRSNTAATSVFSYDTLTNTSRHRFVDPYTNRAAASDVSVDTLRVHQPTSVNIDVDPAPLKSPDRIPNPTSTPATTKPNPPKLERASYLDGLRGLCSIGILLHHWVDSTFGDFHNPSLKTQLPLPTLWTSWTLYVFFILIGRVLVLSFLSSARKGKPNLKCLASSAVRRPFRLLIPTAFVVLLQWGGCRAGWMEDATQAVYSILESRTRGKPGWCDIGDEFSEYLLYVFNFATNFMTPPDMVRYSSALWAIAVSYAGSNLIFFVAVIATAVPKRSWILYAILTLIFWWIESYMFLFIIGLWMADLAVQGVWTGIRDGPKWRMLTISFLSFVVVPLCQWVRPITYFLNNTLPIIYMPSASWLPPTSTRLNVAHINMADWLTAVAVLIGVEIGPWPQRVFKLAPFQWLGKRSIGIYLFHEFVISTIMSRCIVLMHDRGGMRNYDVLVGCSFLLTLFPTLILADIFDWAIEKPLGDFAFFIWRVLFVSEWSLTNCAAAVRDIARGAVVGVPMWLVDGITHGLVRRCLEKRTRGKRGDVGRQGVDDEQVVVDANVAVENNDRENKFKERLYQRDGHCLVTRQWTTLEGSHVLALAWWAHHRRDRLPEGIRAVIRSLADDINDVQNGLLLDKNLAKAWDEGFVTVERVGEEYHMVSLGASWEEYDGVILDVNRRVRKDGKQWAEFMPPDALLNFHFVLCVLNRARAGAQPKEEDEDGDDETVRGSLEESEERRASVASFFGGSEVGEKLANALTLDDVLTRHAC